MANLSPPAQATAAEQRTAAAELLSKADAVRQTDPTLYDGYRQRAAEALVAAEAADLRAKDTVTYAAPASLVKAEIDAAIAPLAMELANVRAQLAAATARNGMPSMSRSAPSTISAERLKRLREELLTKADTVRATDPLLAAGYREQARLLDSPKDA